MEFRKAELVEGVLRLPALRPAPRRAHLSAPAGAELNRLFRSALADLRASASRGDAVDAAIVALLPKNASAPLTTISKAIAAKWLVPAPGDGKGERGRPSPDLGLLAPALYEYAVDAVGAGKLPDAIVALALVAAAPVARPDGLLGLAVCAARLENYDAALVLALETLKHRPGHPRASCIAGRCELERGDRKSAQHHLALAARMARQRPEFRDDLRAAQRLLLMMHIA